MTLAATGRIARDSQGPALVIERDFAAGSAEMWRQLTRPELLGRWFGSFSGTPSVGATIALTMAEDASEIEHVTVLGCNPPRSFIGEFGRAGAIWMVGFELAESTGGGTRMTLRHHVHPNDDLALIGPAWEYYLDRLAAVMLDGQTAPPDDYFDRLGAAYRDLGERRAAHDRREGEGSRHG